MCGVCCLLVVVSVCCGSWLCVVRCVWLFAISVFVVRSSLFVVCCSWLVGVRCLRFVVAYCLLFVGYSFLCVVGLCCSLFGDCCLLLLVVCCVLLACCLLLVSSC